MKVSRISWSVVLAVATWWSSAHGEKVSPERLKHQPAWASFRQSNVTDLGPIKLARPRSLESLTRGGTEPTIVASRRSAAAVFDHPETARLLVTPLPAGKRKVVVQLEQGEGRILLADRGVVHVVAFSAPPEMDEISASNLAAVANAVSIGDKRAGPALADANADINGPSVAQATPITAMEPLPLKLAIDPRDRSVTVTPHHGAAWTLRDAQIQTLPPVQTQLLPHTSRAKRVAQRGS